MAANKASNMPTSPAPPASQLATSNGNAQRTTPSAPFMIGMGRITSSGSIR